MFVFLAPALWALYFFSDEKTAWKLLSAIACSVFAFIQYKSRIAKIHAAENVVAARKTYPSLETDIQEQVQSQAELIIRRCGWSQKSVTFENDIQKFGWYALAMMELKITPNCAIPHWNVIKNPWFAIREGDIVLKITEDRLNR